MLGINFEILRSYNASPMKPLTAKKPHMRPMMMAIICRAQYITSRNSSCKEREPGND